ncbi:MAG: biopolymer transporter ExbD [Deltaproteobacteria bacterium]
MPQAPSKKRRAKQEEPPTLSLTSMMDMLVSILFFLLMSYSAEGEVFTHTQGLKMPISISTVKLKPRYLIQVTTDAIIAEGASVTDVESALKGGDLLIKPLYDALSKNTERVKFLAQNNPSFKFTGEVIIQGDKSLPFALLKKIMFTSGQAGYSGISLAVITNE